MRKGEDGRLGCSLGVVGFCFAGETPVVYGAGGGVGPDAGGFRDVGEGAFSKIGVV